MSLIERLRLYGDRKRRFQNYHTPIKDAMVEAADEIERLRGACDLALATFDEMRAGYAEGQQVGVVAILDNVMSKIRAALNHIQGDGRDA